MKTPTQEEIREEMEGYNADEVGLENPITMEEAEINLLNSDKYYKKCDNCGGELSDLDYANGKGLCFRCNY